MSNPTGDTPTTTPTTPTVAATVAVPERELFSDQERSALVGFLASYSGQTRVAYTLDLRQYLLVRHPRAPPVRREARGHRVLRP